MKALMTAIALATILGPASAQEDNLTKVDKDTVWRQPVVPTEEEKTAALRMAFRLRSADPDVRWGAMVDLTNPSVRAEYNRLAAGDAAGIDLPLTVRTTPIRTEPKLAKADICQRHGRRKVVTGKSWRCR